MPLSPEDQEVLDELVRRTAAKSKSALERWCPQTPTPKQREFLDAPEFEVLYGGAAGGAKSSALLMAALQYVDHPNYAALILRKTYKDLALPGAIMDRSHDWLRGSGARWDDLDKAWVFPGSGARLVFGYLDTPKDKYRYQSAEFQYVGLDEMTQFDEATALYLISRIRRGVDCVTPLRFRGASNPGGIGHFWVGERYVDAKTRKSGCRFIPALLADNPHVDAESYREALSRLDEVTQRQLLYGDWIHDAMGLVYKYSAARNLIHELPDAPDWKYVLGLDFGASLSTPTTSFSVVAFSVHLGKSVLVMSYKKAGLDVTDIAQHWATINSVYPAARTVGDHGALGRGYIQEMRNRHNIPIVDAKKADKYGYLKIMNGDLERATMLVLDGHTQDWQDEATALLWDKTGLKENKGQPNHCCDSGLYAHRETKHFLHKEPEALPAPGTAEYYERQAREELRASRDRRGRQHNIMKDMFR